MKGVGNQGIEAKMSSGTFGRDENSSVQGVQSVTQLNRISLCFGSLCTLSLLDADECPVRTISMWISLMKPRMPPHEYIKYEAQMSTLHNSPCELKFKSDE